MSTSTLEHPSLGQVKGLRDADGVEQFLGIQYATLKDRLAEPVIRTDYTGGIDATQHG
jgi:carboxylesterase type B